MFLLERIGKERRVKAVSYTHLIASPESEFIDFVECARGIITKTFKRKTANWYESSRNAFIAFYLSLIHI